MSITINVPKLKPNSYKPMRGRVVAGACPLHGFYLGTRCEKCTSNEVGEGPAVHIFKPMIYNDICETPLLIESKAQLKRECQKHGVVAVRLL